jgi:hypothetical protein
MSTASVTGGSYAILGSLWSQHFTQNHTSMQYLSWTSNNITPEDFNNAFASLYANALKNYAVAKQLTVEVKNWDFYLMVTVMEAYTYQVLVDLHDQVPLTDALKGLDLNFSPKYDDGPVVYDSVIARIDDALYKYANLESDPYETSIRTTYDKIFGGNMDNWIRFANTLKLRMYLRQIYARPAVATAGITDLLAEDNFLTSDAKLGGFTTQAYRTNPLYGQECASTGHNNINIRGCNTFLDFMLDNNDTRLARIYNYSSGTSYRGIDYGSRPSTSSVPNGSLSAGRFAATDPVVFISAAESQFLQAEAKEWAGQSGKDNYEAGVLASFAKFGLDGSSYIAASRVYEYPLGSDFEEKQKAIITQKWVDCAIANPIESFLEFNRTGYPNFLIPSVGSVITGAFPQRLPFPSSENSRNANVPQQKRIDVKVWWNQKQI